MADAEAIHPPSEPEEPVDGCVRTADGRLHYIHRGGTGPQAHLLHASGFCAGTYAPFIRYLIGELTIFAGDIRGTAAPIL